MKRVFATFILSCLISFASAGNATIYPNPVANEFTLSIEEGKKLKQVDVYNYLGVKVTSVEYTFGTDVVANVSSLKSGKYFVNLNYWDGSREVLQMVKK